MKRIIALCTIIMAGIISSSCQKMSEITLNGSWDVENITIRSYEGGSLIGEESRSPGSGDVYELHFYINSNCTLVFNGKDGADPERKSYTWAMANKKRLILIDENDPTLAAIVYRIDQSYLESMVLTATTIDGSRTQTTTLSIRKEQ